MMFTDSVFVFMCLCLSLCVRVWVYYEIKSTGVPGFWTTVSIWNKQPSLVDNVPSNFSDLYPIIYF